MLQIFGIEHRAIGELSGGDDQGIVNREAETLDKIQAALMGLQRQRNDFAERFDRSQKIAKLGNGEPVFAARDRGELVEDLDADHAAAHKNSLGFLRFRGIGRNEIDEYVRIEKNALH